jgi:hypothetical protein
MSITRILLAFFVQQSNNLSSPYWSLLPFGVVVLNFGRTKRHKAFAARLRAAFGAGSPTLGTSPRRTEVDRWPPRPFVFQPRGFQTGRRSLVTAAWQPRRVRQAQWPASPGAALLLVNAVITRASQWLFDHLFTRSSLPSCYGHTVS